MRLPAPVVFLLPLLLLLLLLGGDVCRVVRPAAAECIAADPGAAAHPVCEASGATEAFDNRRRMGRGSCCAPNRTAPWLPGCGAPPSACCAALLDHLFCVRFCDTRQSGFVPADGGAGRIAVSSDWAAQFVQRCADWEVPGPPNNGGACAPLSEGYVGQFDWLEAQGFLAGGALDDQWFGFEWPTAACGLSEPAVRGIVAGSLLLCLCLCSPCIVVAARLTLAWKGLDRPGRQRPPVPEVDNFASGSSSASSAAPSGSGSFELGELSGDW